MDENRGVATALLDWLPLNRAAQQLSKVLNQDVTEGDLLGFARQKLLTLSVYFPNFIHVKYGEVIHYPSSKLEASCTNGHFPEELEWIDLPPAELTLLLPFSEEAKGKAGRAIRNLQIDVDHYVRFSGEVRSVQGIWDLPMIGGEQIDLIEHEVQQLINGQVIDFSALEGVVLRGTDGTFCQLQEHYNLTEYLSSWDRERRELNRKISNGEIDQEEGERLLGKQKEERKQTLKLLNALPASKRYFPAQRLPKNCVRVVRKEALIAFEEFVNNFSESSNNLTTSTTPEESLYKTSCKPVCAEQISRYFKVKADVDENADWWKDQMRGASRNGLTECREGAGRSGPGGSTWCPDAIAGWLVERYKKGLAGLSEKSAGVALKKFPGCEEAADHFFSLEEE